MEFSEVETFITIAEAGGIGRAAAALCLSQPAVSRRLELLERELGAPLFERFRSGVRLTEAGRTLLPYARQALAATRDGAEAVRDLETSERGVVTLALVGTLASTGLTAQLRAFRIAHPAVRLVLRTARSAEVSDLVQRGDAQLGLRYFADPTDALVAQVVLEEQLIVVCAASFQSAAAAALTPDEVRGVPWIGFPTDTGSSGEPFTQLFKRQLERSGLGDTELIAIDSVTAQKRLVEAGFGLALLPASSVVEELRLGTLRRLVIPEMETTVPVVLLHRRAGYLSRAARRLAQDLARSPPSIGPG